MSTMPQQLDPETLRNLAIQMNAPPPPGVAAPLQLPDSGKVPDLGVPTQQPNLKAPRGTIQGDTAERSRMLDTGAGEDQIYGKITGSQFGQNHPVIGKILGGLAQGVAKAGDIGLSAVAPALAINLPGTEYHHAMQVHQLNRQIGDETAEGDKQAQTADLQSQIPVREALAEHTKQLTATGEPVEITPEQAQSLNMPELAGEKVSPAIMARLSGQHQGNVTKSDTTDANVAGREQVAQTGATSREQVATTNTASREKIASEGDAVKKSLESMRVASGVGKGAQGPTMTTRAMAEMATTVLPRMTAISGEVDRLANELGPAVGRWNELMVNKGGADHPEFAHLDTDLDLLASAIVRTHFGARGGQQYRQELRKQFGEAQSPEDLKARISAAQDWVQGYANMAQPSGGTSQGGSDNDPLKIR